MGAEAMTSAILLAVGGAVFAVLGVLHAVYTWSDLREPRRIVPDDPAVIEAMSNSSVRLSRGGTTMWRAWVGFNFSHSLGAVMFGLACITLGRMLDSFTPPKAALVVPVAIGCIYLWIAIRYWFRIPVMGVAAATVCFALAWLTY
jgi:hypothetical protein